MNATPENDHLQQAEFYNSLINSLPDAVVVVDPMFRIHYCNEAFLRLFDLKIEDTIGKIYGNAIRCKASTTSNTSCLTEGLCSNCRIRNAMFSAFRMKETQPQASILFESGKKETDTLKIIAFQSSFFRLDNLNFVVTVLNDMTRLGSETLRYINNLPDVT